MGRRSARRPRRRRRVAAAMAVDPDVFGFAAGDRDAVLDEMRALADGTGWINFQPDVDPDDLPPTGEGLFRFLSARGPDVPLCTWSPAEPNARPNRRFVSLGVQHGLGAAIARHLSEVDAPVDDRWVVL